MVQTESAEPSARSGAGEDPNSPAPEAPAPALPLSYRSEAGRGELSGTTALMQPLLCWPVALRAVRAWLRP